MQNRITYKVFWLLIMALWPASLVAGQSLHVVALGSQHGYKVNPQPGVTSTVWELFTDPEYSVPATSEQAELIPGNYGYDNIINIQWHTEGEFYLMVTMSGDTICQNRKAWGFKVESQAILSTSTFCQDGNPWIKWNASAGYIPVEKVNIRLLNLDGSLIETLENTSPSGSMLCPVSNQPIYMEVQYPDLPEGDTVKTMLDIPDCTINVLIANNDTVTVWHGVTSTINVLFNDFDSKGRIDSTSVTLDERPAEGASNVSGNPAVIEYRPNYCFFGIDSLTYHIKNTFGLSSNKAKVIIKVEINPYLDSDSDGVLDINENIVGSDNLCDTDTDMDGIPNYLDPNDDDDEILTIDEPGDLDNNGVPDYLENWKSRALDDEASTAIDVPVWINVLANDSSTMVPATLHIIMNPKKGYANIDNVSNDVRYSPGYNDSFEDSFLYVVCNYYDICDTALVTIHVTDPVIPPQVFTPNGDGYNDHYIISGLEKYPENNFVVFNRWGNKVYEKANYTNDWDGNSNAKYTIGNSPLPVGVYYYIIKYANNRIKQGGLYLER